MSSMPNEDKKIENLEETLLLVKGNFNGDDEVENRIKTKEHVKNLAVACLTTLQKHGKAHFRCVGVASVKNAVHACISARAEASKKGMELAFIPSFKTVECGGAEKTAVVLEVIEI